MPGSDGLASASREGLLFTLWCGVDLSKEAVVKENVVVSKSDPALSGRLSVQLDYISIRKLVTQRLTVVVV